MARRRRPARRRTTSSLPSFQLPEIGPEVTRSLVGLTLLVLGAITLIGFVLVGQGHLTDTMRDVVAPWFGSLRWLLPVVLFSAGWYVEWGPGKAPNSGWGLTLAGIGIAYAGALGASTVIFPATTGKGAAGGLIGSFLRDLFVPLVTGPGAFVVLLAFVVVGILLAFNLRLRDLTRPATRIAASLGRAAAESMQRSPRTGEGSADATPAAREAASVRSGGRVRATRSAARGDEAAGQTGMWGEDQPPVLGAPAPTSATFAPALAKSAAGVATASRPSNGAHPDGGLRAGDAGDTNGTGEHDGDGGEAEPPWRPNRFAAPGSTLLDDTPEPVSLGGDDAAHRWIEDQIVKKLKSFDIDAKIVGRNAGPVVTQYEVQPAPHIKVSRIEGLADDLAMALSARSLRIEAPIPGKAAVGIEIPNREFNVVSLRGILDSVDFVAGSRLTFALGRDVAGRAQAVDLAKMPHLLIAGATGSGKSVMVNALITSLLCNATPDDVRMILIDLKRIELASYNGLPHLKERILTEPHEAKSALKWAVHEMEDRYKTFARATARNIKAYNETRDPASPPMPYIVIVIDELADLMMREGKHVEDPIVRLAQKARATGIHMVLATQRPSVNVVTGLIKANFPSRIAFAMASQIDSRTILDAPGAEDLIGRGDMLYQPSDLPRPMRLQGVFVTDPEISRIVSYWRDQAHEQTDYDEDVLGFVESSDEPNGGSQFGWLREMGVDDATIQAAELITATGKASTSYLQTKLRLGFARAARVMDELERYGIVSPQDPARPAAPRHIYGSDNWIMSRNGNALDD